MNLADIAKRAWALFVGSAKPGEDIRSGMVTPRPTWADERFTPDDVKRMAGMVPVPPVAFGYRTTLYGIHRYCAYPFAIMICMRTGGIYRDFAEAEPLAVADGFAALLDRKISTIIIYCRAPAGEVDPEARQGSFKLSGSGDEWIITGGPFNWSIKLGV